MQQFATAPQAVGTRKGRYRDPEETGGNLMNDRRVVRGNTYASVIEPQRQPDPSDVNRTRAAQRARLVRANQTRKARGSTPEPVAGRKHMDIQTDSYMEELTERTVEFEAETQTDFLLDRPPSPLFMPAKIGVDIDTQVEPGELFDFDVECEPVLEVLVGKTLEQAMMEVLEEEELESLRRHQEDYHKRRNAELQEVQRMEAAEKRRADEMQRRVEQQAAQREMDLSIMRKVVARSIATAHLSSVKDRVLSQLLDAGAFTEQTTLGVDAIFMPSLLQMVQAHMSAAHANHKIVQDVARTSVQDKLAKHEAKLAVERQRLRAIDDAELQARAEIKEEKRLKQEEDERLARDQQAMAEWEATEPPKPEVKEVAVASIDAETQKVVLEDETQADCASPEKLQELTELLQKHSETPEEEKGENKVLADLIIGVGLDGTDLLDNFRIDVLGAAAARAAEAEAAEAAEAGEA
eukprot:TRINITY_DN11394_c1_g1_i3.p1 TRINITY_DN11394_c1_g1~~TRINITY_DN11394_c1_g1_i3.p1  ORF type:complete len:499 (+),score=178.65 TRINITY_DN11394_c1_g1_i3:101-1498(+)